MTLTFNTLQRTAFSAIGALLFSLMCISAAVGPALSIA